MIVYFSLGILTGSLLMLLYILRMRMKWKLKYQKENSIFQLVESSKDIIYYFEVKPKFIPRYASPSVDVFLGKGMLARLYSNPNTPLEMVHPDDFELMMKKVSGELDYSQSIIQRFQDMDGHYKWFEEYVTPIYENGEIIAIQGIMRNIDDHMALQQDLEYRVLHDGLTDIYNRYYFDQKKQEYNESINSSVGIIVCDLDELKYLNDHFGHKMGDLLIKECAKLLKDYFKEDGSVSRLGGDEFAIIVVNQSKDYIEDLCKKLPATIDEYNKTQDDIQIKLSMGFAYCDRSLGKMEQLFDEADAKMYKHKIARKSKKNN